MRHILTCSILLSSFISASALAATNSDVTFTGNYERADIDFGDDQLDGLGFSAQVKLHPRFAMGMSFTSLSSKDDGYEFSVSTITGYAKGYVPFNTSTAAFALAGINSNVLELETDYFEDLRDTEGGHEFGIGIEHNIDQAWTAQLVNRWRYIDDTEHRVSGLGLGYSF